MQKMSGLDLSFAVAQMAALLGKRIAKIRRTGEGVFLFKIGADELLFEPGVRLHLTRQSLKAAEAPDGFTSLMRKLFEGKTIEKIAQRENERIVEIAVRSKERLVFELFRKGNLALVGEDGRIISCLNKDESGGRRIAKGEPYSYPKPTGFEIKRPKTARFAVHEENGAVKAYSTDGAAAGGREFSEFGDALDFYYANVPRESEGEKEASALVKRLAERRKSQEEAVARLEKERLAAKEAGDKIYSNFEELSAILELVQKMKKAKRADGEISLELEKHKAKLSGQNVEKEI